MANYYLDIETTGLDPEKSEIITIQFQELDWETGEAKGNLIILKAWDSSEKEIIKEFTKLSNILNDLKWNFVPHGYNLKFEHDFLMKRSEFHGLPKISIFDCPFVDLFHIGIMMNNGQFKGSGLDKITGKEGRGIDVLEWYAYNDYASIERYIIKEAQEYIKFYSWLKKKMPVLLIQFKEEYNLN